MVISSRFLFNYVHALRSFLHRCRFMCPPLNVVCPLGIWSQMLLAECEPAYSTLHLAQRPLISSRAVWLCDMELRVAWNARWTASRTLADSVVLHVLHRVLLTYIPSLKCFPEGSLRHANRCFLSCTILKVHIPVTAINAVTCIPTSFLQKPKLIVYHTYVVDVPTAHTYQSG